MLELRWALLIIGAVFVAGLAWWEFRRPRHASRDRGADAGSDHSLPRGGRYEPMFEQSETAVKDMELPDIRPQDITRDPPLMMLDELHPHDGAFTVQIADEVAVDEPGQVAEEESGEPDETALADVMEAAPPVAVEAAPAPAQPAPVASPVSAPPPVAEPQSVKVVWPRTEQQRIVWLRVVPQPPARFGGRSLRQALTSCGMLHGPQDLFHWADEQGQVIASAANLTRPGTFDLTTMDTQHFHGVNLFAVLPGPLPPTHAFDELLSLARDLAQRLGGNVQDEVGRPVDAPRAAEIRSSVSLDASGGAGA